MQRPTPSPIPARPASSSRAASLSGLAVTALVSGCAVFGGGSVEEASYDLVRRDGSFEIRDYAPAVVAETRVRAGYEAAGEEAFERLFGYISGENAGGAEIEMTAPVLAESAGDAPGEKIDMTAPVLSERDGEGWRYRFVLPSGYALDDAPRPLDPEVSLAETEARRVATVRYSGRATAKARARNARALADWIASEGLEPVSKPRWAGYDAPWTLPPLRRNEVLVDVAE